MIRSDRFFLYYQNPITILACGNHSEKSSLTPLFLTSACFEYTTVEGFPTHTVHGVAVDEVIGVRASCDNLDR